MSITDEARSMELLLWDSVPPTRYGELHDEIVRMALAAKEGDAASTAQLRRLSRAWCVRCATGCGQLICELSLQMSAMLMAAENRYYEEHGAAAHKEGVLFGERFFEEHPEHPAAQLPESRAYMTWRSFSEERGKDRDQAHGAQWALQCYAPPRGKPTAFFIDPRHELPKNVKKAERLDLEDFERLTIEQHAELAWQYAQEFDGCAARVSLLEGSV
jgi:hypothetical protein